MSLSRALVIFFLLAAVSARPVGGIEPTSQDISTAAQEVLAYLERLAAETPTRMLIGQNLGHGSRSSRRGYRELVESLVEETGKHPALLGVDLGYNHVARRFDEAEAILMRHWKRGGLVTLSMHPRNPWRGTDCHDTQIGSMDELWVAGTPANLRWTSDLRRVGDLLETLRDSGMVILWRPFHEANGGWFWWGVSDPRAPKGAARFQRLWRETYAYLTGERNLDNLLWVYSPSANVRDDGQSAAEYFPGADSVDVVGMDWYFEGEVTSLVGTHRRLSKLGKPMGLSEFGPTTNFDGSFSSYDVLQRVTAEAPGLCFVTYWHSWSGHRIALVDTLNPARVMSSTFALDLESIARRLDDD